MRWYDLYSSPQGQMLLVATEDAVSGVYFEGQKYHPQLQADWRQDSSHPALRQAKRELAEYFAGERKRFDTPLAADGTPFQRAVWSAISSVGYGATISYGELARRADSPGSARAAGAATGRNPLTILVPCHRILDAGGGLNGYAGGLARKRALLMLEGALRDAPEPARLPRNRGSFAARNAPAGPY